MLYKKKFHDSFVQLELISYICGMKDKLIETLVRLAQEHRDLICEYREYFSLSKIKQREYRREHGMPRPNKIYYTCLTPLVSLYAKGDIDKWTDPNPYHLIESISIRCTHQSYLNCMMKAS